MNCVIQVRIDEVVKQQLEELAKDDNRTLSGYIRKELCELADKKYDGSIKIKDSKVIESALEIPNEIARIEKKKQGFKLND